MLIEICNIIDFENLIEVGYIKDYRLNRVDFPDGTFCNMFYKGAFIIKNLPTPYVVRDDYPPIEINWFQGNGGNDWREDKFMMTTEVTAQFVPAPITNFGTELTRVVHPEGEPDAKVVNALDIYFTPSVAIFNNSYVEIEFPGEITLPSSIETFDQLTDEMIADPWEPIPCEAV